MLELFKKLSLNQYQGLQYQIQFNNFRWQNYRLYMTTAQAKGYK